jgi:hypothetical protein
MLPTIAMRAPSFGDLVGKVITSPSVTPFLEVSPIKHEQTTFYGTSYPPKYNLTPILYTEIKAADHLAELRVDPPYFFVKTNHDAPVAKSLRAITGVKVLPAKIPHHRQTDNINEIDLNSAYNHTVAAFNVIG